MASRLGSRRNYVRAILCLGLVVALTTLAFLHSFGRKVFRLKVINAERVADQASLPTDCPGRLNKTLLPNSTSEWSSLKTESYFYSAYYDLRENVSEVRIMALSKIAGGPRYCQLWRRRSSYPTVVEASIEYTQVASVYQVTFYVCPATDPQNGADLEYVSITIKQCSVPTNRVRIQIHWKDALVRNWTLCSSPLHDNYGDVLELVESMEMNVLLGVQKIFIYSYSYNVTSLGPYLESYSAQGLLELLPWNLPSKNVVYFAQRLAFNDCLFRNMYSSKYMLFTDLDELIVPRQPDVFNWEAMMTRINSRILHEGGGQEELERTGVYIFQNNYFGVNRQECSSEGSVAVGTQSHSNSAQLCLMSMLNLVRERDPYRHGDRSKYIAVPTKVRTATIHLVQNFATHNGRRCKESHVPNRYGLLHHYKRNLLKFSKNMVNDTTMLKYEEALIGAVKRRHLLALSGNTKTPPN